MNYIIFDLEATCWEDRNNQKQAEIIEIGALKADSQGNPVSEFSEFIQPKLHPELSDFCKELTTIEQSDIDSADPYPLVIAKFKQWINVHEPYVLCSWGFYDKKQFTKDCILHELDTHWLQRHISLKHQYAAIKNLRRPVGINTALQKEGLELEGTHHRGIDDARNIYKIFKAHFGHWSI